MKKAIANIVWTIVVIYVFAAVCEYARADEYMPSYNFGNPTGLDSKYLQEDFSKFLVKTSKSHTDDYASTVLVAGLCIGQYGCDQASQAYLLSHPEVQLSLDRLVMEAKNYVGPTISDKVVPYVMPVVLLGSGRSGTIKLTKYISLTGNLTNQSLNLNFNY